MNLVCLVFIAVSLVLMGPCVRAIDLQEKVDEGTRWIIGVRQKLHQYPELGFKEIETSRTLRLHMDQLRIPYKYAILPVHWTTQTLTARSAMLVAGHVISVGK